MGNFCCPHKSLCIDPATPFGNTSAEAPDSEQFIGYNSGWSGDPPIDSEWTEPGCISQCISTVSQLDADVCAANQQILCATQGPPDFPDGWINPRTGHHYDLCFNQAQTCVVQCPDGLPFSFTEPSGRLLALNCAQADAAALGIACNGAKAHKVCLSDLSQTEVCGGAKYKGTITATGLTVDPTKTIWLNPGGGLPPGIFMDFDIGGGTLTISGTATTVGTYPFTIEVLTPSGDFMAKQFTICVIAITPSSLPGGTAGTAYSQTLAATSCAKAPLNWQVTSGSLPTGLSLNQETGVISGTPTVAGTYNFSITLQTAAS